jgi:2,3-bisphosphoglycerate-independent phosphoglycerate mutase
MQKTPLALIILDGFAHNPDNRHNAVAAASKVNLDRLFQEFPYTELITFGERVGLPDDQMGNSEVGHLNIGAGRVVEQDLLRINRAVRDKTLGKNPTLKDAIARLQPDAALHLIGLCSTGGVHSSLDHLVGLAEAALELGNRKVFVHAITDGRDRPPTASLEEISQLEKQLEELRVRFPVSQIAIVDLIGRYYAMDRDKRWERTKLAYDLYTLGAGELAENAMAAIEAGIRAGLTDEFYKPHRIRLPDHYRCSGCIESGDLVLCFNFRADRMRQIVSALLGDKVAFDGFVPEKAPVLGGVLTLTEYEGGLPVEIIFPPVSIKNNLGTVISNSGLTQLRLAETEKYPHVTYFFNSGEEEPYTGEERALIPSPRDVATYDLKPEMSAHRVTETFLDRLGHFDFYVVNYANCDMVGHTGVFDAAKKAVETVDTCVGKVVEKILSLGGVALITADHGNADQMVDYETGEPHTFHTKYPVPFCLVGRKDLTLRGGGALCDIAPTVLKLLGIPQPEEMTGRALID